MVSSFCLVVVYCIFDICSAPSPLSTPLLISVVVSRSECEAGWKGKMAEAERAKTLSGGHIITATSNWLDEQDRIGTRDTRQQQQQHNGGRMSLHIRITLTRPRA